LQADSEKLAREQAFVVGATATGAAPCVGSVIGDRYRLECALNAGGMGTVYLAQPTTGNRKVVVKFPHLHLMGSPGFLARFKDEIRALQNLTHAHIVEIYDAGVHGHLPYLVVRYMPGGSLADRIQASPDHRLSIDELDWLPAVADALDFVHAQGILHRDVKPANLLFDEFGNVHLTDFGVAKILGDANRPDLTVSGTVGSPAYMAPEQMYRDLTPRGDQYSLAVVVYHALSGSLPHEAQSTQDLLVERASRPPVPLSDRVSGLPPDLVEAVMRALSIDPADRFESCTAFSEAVMSAVERAPLPRPRSLARAVTGVLAMLLLLGGALAIYTQPWSRGDAVAPSSVALDATLLRLGRELPRHEQTISDLRADVTGLADQVSELAARAIPPPVAREREALDRSARVWRGVSEPTDAQLAELRRARPSVDRLIQQGKNTVLQTREHLGEVGGIQNRVAVLDDRATRRAEDLDASFASLDQARAELAALLSAGGASEAAMSDRNRQLETLATQAEALSNASNALRTSLTNLDRDLLDRQHEFENELRSMEGEITTLVSLRDSLEEMESSWLKRRAETQAPEVNRRRTSPPRVGPAPRSLLDRLVEVPAGSFRAGCDLGNDPSCSSRDEAAATRELPRFFIDRTEVTVADYRACVAAHVCTPARGLPGARCNAEIAERSEHPINCVRFDQAAAYCDWAGKRLPTEQEWEKAARGTDARRYPWGSDPPTCDRAAWIQCTRSTTPVGTHGSGGSPYGIQDMAGNVWEWTKSAETDTLQIVRGGSFRSNANGLGTAHRASQGRTVSSETGGFRCARDTAGR